MTLSLPRPLADRIADAGNRHNVSVSSLVEALLLYAFEQLPPAQFGEELKKRGASLRRRV